MTSQKSQMMKSEQLEPLTLSAEDFRAKLSALRELDEDSKILEELSSLKLHGLQVFSNPSIFSLKTSKDSSTTMEETPWEICNSKNFGVPQNRERVFIVGHLRGECARNVFPIIRENAKSDNQQSKIEIVGNTKNPSKTGKGTGSNVYYSKGLVGTLCARDYKEPKQIAIPKIRVKEATKQGYAEATIGDSINLSYPNSKTRRGRVGKQIANTLLTGESQGVVEPDFRIRVLTPREYWRLQGFPDWAFDKAQEVNSNSQLYKQAGNSVTVNVIEAIAREF